METTRKLSKDEFLATMSEPMKDVTKTATDVIDIWPYVNSVPRPHWDGHERFDDFVDAVKRSGNGHYDHVLVMTKTKNVFLVVIVDLKQDLIHGHHLLDLNKEYGLD